MIPAQGIWIWYWPSWNLLCWYIYNKNPTTHGRSGYYILISSLPIVIWNYSVVASKEVGWELLISKKEIPVLVDGVDTTILTVQEVQQLLVILLTFQQTPQATVRCVGELRPLIVNFMFQIRKIPYDYVGGWLIFLLFITITVNNNIENQIRSHCFTTCSTLNHNLLNLKHYI